VQDSTQERRRFAVPAAEGVFGRIDLSLLDPADPDHRHFLILAEHPDVARAIERGEGEIVVGGAPMNPRLLITIHEIVANQLWDDDPPEVWQSARRLLAAGCERHEILHMLGSVVAEQVWEMLHERRPHDRDRFAAALDALPDSWEASARVGETVGPPPRSYLTRRRSSSLLQRAGPSS